MHALDAIKRTMALIAAREVRRENERAHNRPGRFTLHTAWKKVRLPFFAPKPSDTPPRLVTGWWETPLPWPRQRRRLEYRARSKAQARKLFGSTKFWRRIEIEPIQQGAAT